MDVITEPSQAVDLEDMELELKQMKQALEEVLRWFFGLFVPLETPWVVGAARMNHLHATTVRSTLEHESIARDPIQIVQKNGSRGSVLLKAWRTGLLIPSSRLQVL